MKKYDYNSKKQIEKKIEEQEYEGKLYPLFESNQNLVGEIYKEKGIISDENQSSNNQSQQGGE